MYVSIYICNVYVYMCAYIYIHTYACKHIYAHTYMYLHIHVCVYIYIHTYLYTLIHTHTHTHIHICTNICRGRRWISHWKLKDLHTKSKIPPKCVFLVLANLVFHTSLFEKELCTYVPIASPLKSLNNFLRRTFVFKLGGPDGWFEFDFYASDLSPSELYGKGCRVNCQRTMLIITIYHPQITPPPKLRLARTGKIDFLGGILDFVCKSKFSIAVKHPLPLSIKTAAVKKVEKNLHFKFSKKTSELFFRGPLFQCFLPIIHVWPRLQQSKTHTLKRVLWSFGNANRPVS